MTNNNRKKSTNFLKNNKDMINPCTSSLIINVTINETYIKREHEFIKKTIELESDRFLKLFCYNEYSRTILRNLSNCGSQLFIWVITELQGDEDCIRINKKRFKEECNIKSNTTVLEAIKELINKAIIVPTTEKELYWINPAIMFSGNRIEKYKTTAQFNYRYIKQQ